MGSLITGFFLTVVLCVVGLLVSLILVLARATLERVFGENWSYAALVAVVFTMAWVMFAISLGG